MDYVIMLDDDQYVLPETIFNVYKHREPVTYKTWFGKNWDSDIRKPNYWHPKEMTCVKCPIYEWQYKLPHVYTWEYGGTGMSIIDAKIFKVRELYELEPKYQRIEDIWLSYMVKRVNFTIGRLKVIFMVDKSLSSKGQWGDLKKLKQEFFEYLDYLR